jgi:hypothetical protein
MLKEPYGRSTTLQVDIGGLSRISKGVPLSVGFSELQIFVGT